MFIVPASPADYNRGATRLARHLDQATLDWSGPSEYGKWGMGLDVQDKVDNLYNYQASVDPSTGAETADPDTTNGYAVKTTLTALTNAKLQLGMDGGVYDGSRRGYTTDTSTFRQAGFDHFVARRIYVGLVKKFE